MTSLGQKVIYQIYPKSFYDSNHDGVGDLRGIIEKIDYLKKLNIDMVWLNPIFVSPQKDNGYDIADYLAIDPRFGTMADFEELVATLKAAGIDVMLDMVFNHCSTAHPWFQKALAGDPYYQDFFYLRPPKADGSLPTNWQSKFGGPAWAPFGESGNYYLHLYDVSQADLDWHNPAVRQELIKVVNFWYQKGVRGFRFDVLNVIGKSEHLVDSTDPQEEKMLYTDTPVVEDYIKELAAGSFGRDPAVVTVGEMSSTSIERAIAYTKPADHELSMTFSFYHLKVDYQDGEKWSQAPASIPALKKVLIDWQTGLDQGGGWQALFWNNHDQPWALNRFGDPDRYRVESATMLASALHLMRGTPYIYMGEELGMIDPAYDSIEDYEDVEAQNAYRMLVAKGKPAQEAFAIVHAKARDNSRGPMHWTAGKAAGFTTATPWLKPTDQDRINVANELAHGKIFNYYQRLIALRRQEPLVSAGHFRATLVEHPRVFAFERFLKGESAVLAVVNNFSAQPTTIDLPDEWQARPATVALSNYDRIMTETENQLVLAPYESLALKLAEPKTW